MIIAFCTSSLLSFSYGMLIVQYQVFPFEQLRTLKQTFSSEPKQKPKPKLNHSNYFYHKTSFFKQHGQHHYDVVFIGDSITDRAEWEDLFPSLNIANRGIDGDRTDGVLRRLDSIYSTSAKRAFIMLGINDINAGVSPGAVFENYQAIVNQLSEHGMQVYIQSTLFAGKRRENLNAGVIELNEKMQQLASKDDSITYIDLNKALSKDSLLNSIYSRDDVHLNAKGYAIWKEIISPYIQ